MLPQTSITFNDVKVIIASLVENLELNQQVILKKIIFDSLVKHPSFNMSFVKSAQELRDLMACFSIAERAIILNKFQTLLPKFSESTDLFHSMVRDLSENSLIFADYYDEVMPHFTGNARTAAFSVIYTSILHECRMNDYYVIKSDDIPTKETLHHLPSHVKEAYVRCIYIKDTSESEILRMTNTLYYVDRSLALCHQIHLTPKELDEFDQIEFGNSKKLSTKTLEKFSLLLREKTDFYCNASGFADYETNQDFSVDMVLQKTTQFINSNSTEKPCMPALRQLCNHLSMFRDNPSHNILNGMKEILVEAYMQTLIEHKCSSSHSPEYKSNIYTLQFIQSLINHINKCGALINDAPLTKTQLKIKEFNERRNAKKNKSSETNKKTVKPVTEPLDMGGRTNQQAQACPQSHKKLSEAQIRILKNLKSGRAEPIQPAKDQTPDYSFYKLMDAFSDRRSFVNPFIRGCFFASVSLLIGGISSLLSPEHKVKTGLVVGAGIFGSLSLFMGIKTQNIDDKDVAKDAAKNNIR